MLFPFIRKVGRSPKIFKKRKVITDNHKEINNETVKRPYRYQNGNVRDFKPKDRNDKANAFQRDKQ